MLDFVALVDHYRQEGYEPEEINDAISQALSEAQEEFMEQYEDDPMVQEGWHQQDVIDMYRRER